MSKAYDLPKLPPITVGPEVFCRLAGTPIIPGYPFGRVACKTLCGDNDCMHGRATSIELAERFANQDRTRQGAIDEVADELS